MKPILPAMLRTTTAWIALVLVVTLAVAVIVAPFVVREAGEGIRPGEANLGPSGEHWLGTDSLGRDSLARTLLAGQLSLLLAFACTVGAFVIGVAWGLLPAVLSGRLSRLLASTIDILVAFPGVLLAMFLAMILGIGAFGATVALAVAMAPGFARLTYTTASSIAASDFVAAARLLGVGRWRIMTRHLIPNISGPILVYSATAMGAALLSFSALAYLGFGVQSPQYDWGTVLNDALPSIAVNPAAAIAPALAILVTGVGFVLLGEIAARGADRSESRRAGWQAEGAPSPSDLPDAIVQVEDLRVTVPVRDGSDAEVVRGVSLTVEPGEIVGLVGESGSGKSLTAAALGDLLPHGASARAAHYRLMTTDVRTLPDGARRHFLGTRLATVFQDALGALNPALRLRTQLTEHAIEHRNLSRKEAASSAVSILEDVGLHDASQRLDGYPQQLSGGQSQRVVIAMSVMNDPRLIIADEPTTALDVRTQQDVIALLRRVQQRPGRSVLFISHDLSLVSQVADRVLVMYSGKIVEELAVGDLLRARHPYTQALLKSLPTMTTDKTQPLASLSGQSPGPTTSAPGCRFAPRCEFATDRCRTEEPALSLSPASTSNAVACWHPVAS